jgi:hypothetical protein
MSALRTIIEISEAAAAEIERLRRELAEVKKAAAEAADWGLARNRELAEAHALLREAHVMQWKSDVEYADWRRRINEHLGGESEDNR